MGLTSLTKKKLHVSRGHTYTYYTADAKSSKPSIILLHGWPDTAILWAGLINDYLVPHGYGIVALDCLGYGETSKPTDLVDYQWHHMTEDAIEILDKEKLSKVISLGHDWGSALCQRLDNFYPERVSGLVMINVAYIPPTGQFNLDLVNQATREAFGVGVYEYMHFFTADDGRSIMHKSPESVYTVAFGDPQTWLENFCSPHGMRKYITEGRTQPTLSYATPEHKADFMKRFSSYGSFEAPSFWYKGFVFGL